MNRSIWSISIRPSRFERRLQCPVFRKRRLASRVTNQSVWRYLAPGSIGGAVVSRDGRIWRQSITVYAGIPHVPRRERYARVSLDDGPAIDGNSRRALKETGSIFLHCDTTASHYLKLLMDAIFDPRNFRNAIVWKRRVGSSSAVHSANRYGDVTDDILFYAKSAIAPFQVQYSMDAKGYDEYLAERFKFVDESGRKFRTDNLANPAL